MMRRFLNARGGKDIWINPEHVILAEPHTVTHLQGQDSYESHDTRLVLTNGGAVFVSGTLAETLADLGVTE